MSFSESLDDLLQRVADDMEVSEMWATRSWVAWEDIVPYKSRRMKKSTGTDAEQDEQDAPQDAQQDAPQASKPQAAKTTSKTSKASKAASKASKAASKTSAAKK